MTESTSDIRKLEFSFFWLVPCFERDSNTISVLTCFFLEASFVTIKGYLMPKVKIRLVDARQASKRANTDLLCLLEIEGIFWGKQIRMATKMQFRRTLINMRKSLARLVDPNPKMFTCSPKQASVTKGFPKMPSIYKIRHTKFAQ